jgi:hypothetical protein
MQYMVTLVTLLFEFRQKLMPCPAIAALSATPMYAMDLRRSMSSMEPIRGDHRLFMANS